jgi:hypothetical protein
VNDCADLHAFLRDTLDDIYPREFSIERLHKHCSLMATSRRRKSDSSVIVRSNALASVAAVASVTMTLIGIRQTGSPAAAAPALSLCCALFGIVFSVWIAVRDCRPLYLLLGVWALVPLLWSVYYLLVIDPALWILEHQQF